MTVERSTPLEPVRLMQKVGAEMIGTFALVFAGCGAIMVNTISGGTIGHAGIAATFGLVIMVMIYATGHICGAHFNPAVTLAFALCKRFPFTQVPAYIAGQCVAATLAAYALQLIIGPVADMGVTAPAGDIWQTFALEVVLTFFLMFVITAVATDARAVGTMAGWAIGGTVTLCAMFGGPISGASMNPARSLGPAIASMNFEYLSIYLAAPILGAALGALAYRFVQCGDADQSATGCC